MSTFNFQPELIGSLVKLKPIEEDDFEALFEIANDTPMGATSKS